MAYILAIIIKVRRFVKNLAVLSLFSQHPSPNLQQSPPTHLLLTETVSNVILVLHCYLPSPGRTRAITSTPRWSPAQGLLETTGKFNSKTKGARG